MGDFIPTKGSSIKRKPQEAFEVVTFNSYKSKKSTKGAKKDNEDVQENKTKDKTEGSTLSIKRTKFEVVKFGMSGFDAKKKQDAKVQLAIRLGAKPPKNKYKNYKELLLEKKEEKKKLADDMDFQELGKNKVGKSVTKTNALKKKRKPEGGLIDVYGVVKTAKIKR